MRKKRACLLAVAVATLGMPALARAATDVSLNVIPDDLQAPNAGGVWTLVARTDDADGIAAIRATLVDVANGAVADGDPQDDVSLAAGIGALDPVATRSGPRPPYLDRGDGSTELLYGQDISDPLTVVTEVGRPATGGGPDPLGDPAWNDATTIASGTYPGAVPQLAGLVANELDQSSPPFTASAASVTSTVRVLPEPGGVLSAGCCLAALSLLATRARRRRRAVSAAGAWLCALALLAPGTEAGAQATGDPIDGSAPIAHWSLVLEDVVTIPNSSFNAPRLEYLTGNPVTGLAYVIDQRGRIYSFDPAAASPSASLFVDLDAVAGSLFTGNEAGVRGLAFHPDFGDSEAPGHRKAYVTFSQNSSSSATGSPDPIEFTAPGSNSHFTVLAELTLDAAGDVVTSSYRELMRIEQPFSNHNAGHIGFDPSATPGSAEHGMLYLAVGDGGSAAGPFDLSQDIDVTPAPYPHGKILRIDPLEADGEPYSIPADNPFAGRSDRIEEAWAYGLRNSHKFEWDAITGEMYLSDIGQGVVEEISIGRPEANYGWNLREGAFVFANNDSVSPLPAGHASDAFAYPVAQYDHRNTNGINGSSAIVGGPVYRGDDVPELTGLYLFAEFASNPGPIFAVDVDDLVERDDFTNIEQLDDGRLAPYVEVEIRDGGADKDFRQFLRDANSSSGIGRTDLRWGVDAEGEVYVLNKRDGMVRRIAGVVELEPGDANRDGSVDGLDLDRWQAGFGSPGDWSDANFDAGPTTDGDDFILWQRNSGGSIP